MNKTTSTRGRTFTGIVTSNKMTKTVAVEWTRRHYIPKYERYETRRTKVKAHDETEAEIGDTVVIKETRPLSKTKNFIVIENLKANLQGTGKSEEKVVEEEKPKKVAAKKAPVKKVEKSTEKVEELNKEVVGSDKSETKTEAVVEEKTVEAEK